MKKTPKIKGVLGVGTNDSPYQVTSKVYIDGVQKTLLCPVYDTWVGMLKRCYSERTLKKQPSYAGCKVVDEWLYFSNFLDWANKNRRNGMVLDKDLLGGDVKIYSPDTCVFVSQQLNNFILDRSAGRGEYPIGVNWNKRDAKFMAQVSNPFTAKNENLGYYDNPQDAHLAWKKRKHELACIYADDVKNLMGLLSDKTHFIDNRVPVALKTRFL